jgi:hypothetical protein
LAGATIICALQPTLARPIAAPCAPHDAFSKTRTHASAMPPPKSERTFSQASDGDRPPRWARLGMSCTVHCQSGQIEASTEGPSAAPGSPWQNTACGERSRNQRGTAALQGEQPGPLLTENLSPCVSRFADAAHYPGSCTVWVSRLARDSEQNESVSSIPTLHHAREKSPRHAAGSILRLHPGLDTMFCVQ